MIIEDLDLDFEIYIWTMFSFRIVKIIIIFLLLDVIQGIIIA